MQAAEEAYEWTLVAKESLNVCAVTLLEICESRPTSCYSQIAPRLGVSRSAIEKQMMHVIQALADRFPE